MYVTFYALCESTSIYRIIAINVTLLVILMIATMFGCDEEEGDEVVLEGTEGTYGGASLTHSRGLLREVQEASLGGPQSPLVPRSTSGWE